MGGGRGGLAPAGANGSVEDDEQDEDQPGGDLGDLVSLSVFLLEPHDFGAVSAVRDARLREPPPASTLVYVSGFVEMGVRVEISGLAMIDRAGARG